VRGIRRQSHAILRGTLIGVAGGMGTALVMCASTGGCGDEADWLMLITTEIGAAAGSGIGAIVNPQTANARTIYANQAVCVRDRADPREATRRRRRARDLVEPGEADLRVCRDTFVDGFGVLEAKPRVTSERPGRPRAWRNEPRLG
jgi:hypothetical protein